MISLANLTREGFKNGDISNLMSPELLLVGQRTILSLMILEIHLN